MVMVLPVVALLFLTTPPLVVPVSSILRLLNNKGLAASEARLNAPLFNWIGLTLSGRLWTVMPMPDAISLPVKVLEALRKAAPELPPDT
jgi:hypothetical protein